MKTTWCCIVLAAFVCAGDWNIVAGRIVAGRIVAAEPNETFGDSTVLAPGVLVERVVLREHR